MNDNERARQLAEHSYLWTSGEWTLQRTHHYHVRVILVFPGGKPTPQELLAVRALIPRFADSPMSLLKAEVGGLSEFLAGEFGGIEAPRLLAAAHTRGLKTRTENTSYISYTPVSIHGALLHIDDHELATLLGEEMQRRGVPVSHVEAD